MKKIFLFVGFATLWVSQLFAQENSNVKYVDNQIGANNTRASNCVIGPQLPFGSINPSPQTVQPGKKNTSGYVPGELVMGFGQLHVSGTGGAGKYGHFLISPQIGTAFANSQHLSSMKLLATQPHYFKCLLEKYGIEAEISPTHHATMYQLTYPTSNDASIVLDATQSIPRDIFSPKGKGKIFENEVKYDLTKKQVRAMIKYQGGWGGSAPYNLYMVAEVNQPFDNVGLWNDSSVTNGVTQLQQNDDNPHRIGFFIKFKTKSDKKVLVKLAISFKSYDNAEKYLKEEIPNWEFEEIKKKAFTQWDNQLLKIQIQSNFEEQKKIFYTALYHSMVMPRDRTGDNSKWEGNQPYWDDHYAVWDTWRTLFPLQMILNPSMVRGNVLSFLDRYKHNGAVRDAFISGIDNFNDQGGNDVDNVIADACVKGLDGIDWNEAYQLLKFNAEKERIGFPGFGKISNKYYFPNEYKTQGWIPQREEGWNCSSFTLEYAYNDFCVAQVANKIGNKADYEKYYYRSKSWLNLWDTALVDKGYKGFIGVKDSVGQFTNFDVAKVFGSYKYPFYEGSSWTYSYFVPHDIDKLIALMGGNQKFVERLDFAVKNKLIDYANEPSFLALRLFAHAGNPNLGSSWIRKAMNKNFDLSGVAGNDDSGAMSSWYIFSALGFFPNAGQDTYYLNAPLYAKSEIVLPNGKKLIIKANNVSDDNVFIQSCKLNGTPLKKAIIKHSDLLNGGLLEFDLVGQPTSWGN